MHHKNSGFAILETLISVLIVSFGVLALAKFQANLHTSQDVSTHRTEAQALAQAKLNEVAATLAGATLPPALSASSDFIEGTSTQYTRAWTISFDTVGNALVESKVTWTDSRGRSDYVVLNSVVLKGSLENEARLLAAQPGFPPSAGQAIAPSPPWGVTSLATPGKSRASTIGGLTYLWDTERVVPAGSQTISGAFALEGGAAIGKVAIGGTGATCSTASTTVPYGYSCVVPNNWSGTLTVTSSEGADVKPPSRRYTSVTVSFDSNNYLIKKIEGGYP